MKRCKCCKQEIIEINDFKGFWNKFLKGKEVRGMYYGDGSFDGSPDCYKYEDIKLAFEKLKQLGVGE